MSKRYFKFYPSLGEALETRMCSRYSYDDIKELDELLEIVSNSENKVINDDVFKRLKKIKNFKVEKFVFCSVESLSELKDAVKLRPSFFLEIEDQKSISEYGIKVRVNTALNKRVGYCLPTLYFRRIEYLLKKEYSKYIDKAALPKNLMSIVSKLNTEEEKDIIYFVLRELSEKYKYGYKFKKDINIFILERRFTLEFYWRDGSIFLGKQKVAMLTDGIKRIAKNVDRVYKKTRFEI